MGRLLAPSVVQAELTQTGTHRLCVQYATLACMLDVARHRAIRVCRGKLTVTAVPQLHALPVLLASIGLLVAGGVFGT